MDTCQYFQGLLESNDYHSWEHEEFLEGLPSKRACTDANLHASQLYNDNIRESVLKEIPPLTLSKCGNIYLHRNMYHLPKTLYLQQENKWLT